MKDLFIKESRVIEGAICVDGNSGKLTGSGINGKITINDFNENEAPTEEFTKTVAIITNGYGEWKLNIPSHIRENLIDIRLKIDTIRFHGMLHSAEKNGQAKIYINGELVDIIRLVKERAEGVDFGVDSRRELPIFRYIDRKKGEQVIRIETESNVSWDIDQVMLLPVIKSVDLRNWVYMVIGAVIPLGFDYISKWFSCCCI